jgi:hypothetical protein
MGPTRTAALSTRALLATLSVSGASRPSALTSMSLRGSVSILHIDMVAGPGTSLNLAQLMSQRPDTARWEAPAASASLGSRNRRECRASARSGSSATGIRERRGAGKGGARVAAKRDQLATSCRRRAVWRASSGQISTTATSGRPRRRPDGEQADGAGRTRACRAGCGRVATTRCPFPPRSAHSPTGARRADKRALTGCE